MSELQRTYDHEAYLTTRQIIDHDIFVNMSAGKSRVQSVTDVLDHYCSITGKYDKMTPTQKYAFLDEIGNQIDLAIDDARLDIGYIILLLFDDLLKYNAFQLIFIFFKIGFN